MDVVESLAIDRAKALFGAEHANVQPHSGAQANMSVFLAVLKPGDTILGMNLAHGGHLTHGHPLNFSGKYFNVVPYGVRKDDERLDYDELAAQARAHKPKLIIVGASAYPRVIDFARIRAGGRRGRRADDDRHGPHRGPGGRRRPSEPGPALGLRHHDDAQDAARATRRPGAVPAQHAKDLDRAVFPGVQGGPLVHVIAAKAVCLKEAATPEFASYQTAGRRQRRAAGRRRSPPAASASSAAAPTTT